MLGFFAAKESDEIPQDVEKSEHFYREQPQTAQAFGLWVSALR